MTDKLFGIDIAKPAKIGKDAVVSREKRHSGKIPLSEIIADQTGFDHEEQVDNLSNVNDRDVYNTLANREQIVVPDDNIDDDFVKGGD